MIRLIINFNTEKEYVREITNFPCTIGRSKENDVHIDDESLSSFHVQIVKEDNNFVIKDLNEESKTFFKEKPIKEQKIEHGDALRLGRVNILFQIKIEEAALIKKEYLPEKAAKGELVPGEENICENCGAPLDPSKAFCHRCGYRKGKYLPTDIFIGPVEKRVSTGGAGILPLLSFIFSIFGPLLLGIGWILGIFLGIVSLIAIRKRGGFARDKRLALSGVVIGFLWFIIISISGSYYTYHWRVNKIITRNEKEAITALKNIAVAEKIAKSSLYFDKDSNGVAEYVVLKELGELNLPFIDENLLKGKITGYKIEILQFNEENFVCEAVPEKYGRTGKRSFMVQADGFIRGSDIGGASTVDKGKELPMLFQGKSVYTDYSEEIARKLLRVAEKMAKEGNYEKSKRIIEEIRTSYPLTEVQKELDSIASSVDPFIISFRSSELYDEAKKEIISKNLIRARDILQEICNKYPASEIISEVKEDMEEVNFKIDEKLSQEAKVLFEEAKLDYQAGRYEEASKKYRQLGKMYPGTQYFQKNKELLEKLIAEGDEKIAEKLLKQVMEANIEKDFLETKRVVDLLESGYKDTRIYQENKDRLANIQNNCIAHSLFQQALKEKEQGEYRMALTHLEKSIEINPNLKGNALNILSGLYSEAGNQYFNESDYLSACAYYEKSIALDPKGKLIDRDKLKKAFYEVGRIAYEKEDYISCKNRLMGLEAYFKEDKEFNYLLANACIKAGDYDNAVKYYSICYSLDNSVVEYVSRRGLTHLALALEVEKNIEVVDTTEVTHKLFLEISEEIVKINDKVQQLKPVLGLGSEARAKAKLIKERAVGEFLTSRDAISSRAMEYNKKDKATLESLENLKKELKDGVTDLKTVGDLILKGSLKEIETKANKKLAIIEKIYDSAQESFKKLCSLRNSALQRLYNAISSLQREFSIPTGESDLNYIFSGQLPESRTNIIKCWDAIYACRDINIDVEGYISELD